MILLGSEDGPTLIDQRFPQYRAWKFLAPTCTEEVLVGMEGIAPRTDLVLSAETLARLTFRSQRGERRLRHVNGAEVTSSIGLQGIYRLSEASAAELSALIGASPPSAGPRIPRPANRRGDVPVEDALF
jgi:hypothetical protein